MLFIKCVVSINKMMILMDIVLLELQFEPRSYALSSEVDVRFIFFF